MKIPGKLLRNIVEEIISYIFCHRGRKLLVVQIIRTGSVITISHDESKESGRMLQHLVNTLLCLHKVPLGDLNILIFMILTTNSNNNDTV